MIEHLLLGDIAALLLVLGLTGPLIAPILRIRLFDRLRVLAHPFVAFPLWAIDTSGRIFLAPITFCCALVLMSGWTGIDFSACRSEEVVRHMRNDAIHSAIDRFTIADPQKVWTVGEVADFIGIGGASPIIVGSPGRVAHSTG